MTPISDQSIFEYTSQRLRAYTLFSEASITMVAKVAAHQSTFVSYKDYFKKLDIPEPSLYVTPKGRGVTVVDRAARQSPQKGVIVMHLPMNNPLDTNQLFQVATMVDSFPAYRVIAFGNPSGAPYAYPQQNLSLSGRLAIAFTRNRSALVEAELAYLAAAEVKGQVYHAGYSYGAHKALIATQYAPEGAVDGLIALDPVARPQPLLTLARAFQSTLKNLDRYVQRTKQPIFLEARRDASGITDFHKGLRRRVNIAIAMMLARTDFIYLLNKVLTEQPRLHAAIAWGTKSELGDDAHMTASLATLAAQYPQRVTAFRCEGDEHALANDIYLHAAIVAEALEATSRAVYTVTRNI